MCHSLSSWQGTNDGRKALAVPGLPLPPLRCCRLLPASRIPASAAQPGMGAVGRTRTWGNWLWMSHITARLGTAPSPGRNAAPPCAPWLGEESCCWGGDSPAPQAGQRSRGQADMPQPQRLSVPLSPAVTSCCVVGTPPPPSQASGDNREGQPMALPHPCPWKRFAWQGNKGDRLAAEIRATALARALIAGGNWLQRCLAHAAEPGRAWAAGFGRALRAQLDARARHCHRGPYRHRGRCAFPPQSQATRARCPWQRWREPCLLAASWAALLLPEPCPAAGDAPCSRGHGCRVSCLRC